VQYAEKDSPFFNSTIIFGPGEKKLVNVGYSAFSCLKGNLKSMLLSFNYKTAYGIPKTEASDKQLVVRCNYGDGGAGSGGATALAITTSSLPAGQVGAAYSTTLQATGGTPPYAWTMSICLLPNGLSLSSSGAISGMPAAGNTCTKTPKFRVTDSTGAYVESALSITTTCEGQQCAVLDTCTLCATG